MIFFKKRRKKSGHSKTYYEVNGWCESHQSELQEIKNYISFELAQGRRPSSELIDEAAEERGIDLPFSARDLAKYCRTRLF